MNQVNLIGRVATTPELRYRQNGNAFTTMRVAVDRPGPDGERTADFFSVITNGKQAEAVAKHLQLGQLVGITGGLRTRQYEHEKGVKITDTFISAREVKFLSPRNGNASANGAAQDEANEHNEEAAEPVANQIPF